MCVKFQEIIKYKSKYQLKADTKAFRENIDRPINIEVHKRITTIVELNDESDTYV